MASQEPLVTTFTTNNTPITAQAQLEAEFRSVQYHAHNRKIIKHFVALLVLAIISILAYQFWGFPKWGGFIMHSRAQTLGAVILTATAIGASSMMFQALVNNRIITPSIMGLDSLYMLIQTLIVFIAGAKTLLNMNQVELFIYSSVILIVFSILLFQFMFNRESQNIFFICLIGLVFGTLFDALTSFMGTLLDPGQWFAVQDAGFASFNRINTKLLSLATIVVVIVAFFIYRNIRYLDAISMGRDQAVNLGVNYHKISLRIMILVAICTAVATSLVGPITFLGLLVMNLTLQLLPTYKYKILVPAGVLMSIIVLVMGQVITQRILNFGSTISIVINFVGGLYFIYLLLRKQKKW